MRSYMKAGIRMENVFLRNPTAIMTIQPTANFWKEVQALTAHHYSLERLRVVTTVTLVPDTQLKSSRKPSHNRNIQ